MPYTEGSTSLCFSFPCFYAIIFRMKGQKTQKTSAFKLAQDMKPAGDQAQAIEKLVTGLRKGMRHQTLLGVTGSGKTFTAANIIAEIGKPTLVIAHNKTLAAQLAQEYREFFPNNAVHYFVSYYDYYQPEAYLPTTDTYIEKEAQINEEIERLRHASTQALLTRRDVIIVATVSCIYGLGSPVEYKRVNLYLKVGDGIVFEKNASTTYRGRDALIRRLIHIHYERTQADLEPGQFRALGKVVEIMPVNERIIYRIELDGESGAEIISHIDRVDAITRRLTGEVQDLFIFPAKHFITDEKEVARAIADIQTELTEQLAKLNAAGKILEAERLKRRTNYDLALIREVGYCNGIENYSRHFSGKPAGEAPDTLLSYFPHIEKGPDAGKADFLTIIDESHVTVPQLGAMFAGDASRKQNLVEHGFRLPSARDNRPLKFDEFEQLIGQTIYTSATPGKYELEHSKLPTGQIAEQIIRPTGLIDPEIVLMPVTGKGTGARAYQGQVPHFIDEAEKVIKGGGRVLATTLTKKMAEDLTEFLKERGMKAEYLHSEVLTMDRVRILTDFRKGVHDCIVGVNLLREGLDLPEVELIGIFDADKEGFLRSETSLIQTIGRAARNVKGRVILYADSMTGSMDRAIAETNRRRALQVAYNTKHGITPKTIIKHIHDITDALKSDHDKAVHELVKIDEAIAAKDPKVRRALIAEKRAEMEKAAEVLDFETAALIRDEIKILEELDGKAVKAAKKEEKAEMRKFGRVS